MDQSLANFGPIGWDRLGVDIDGEAANDLSGYSVSISGDGTIVAIGANNNDGTGSNAGHVRVYKYNPLSSSFNQEIGLWNTSSVTNMSSMFENCNSFNKNISNWIVSQVTSFSRFRLNSGLTDIYTPIKFR
jgi:surface protein